MAGLERLGPEVYEAARELPPPIGSETPKSGSGTRQETVRGIPPGRFRDSFDNFDLGWNAAMGPALERCRAVAEGKAWCAFLSGPDSYGTGKTHLTIAALKRWMEIHDNGLFWKVPDFLDHLRRAVSGEGSYPFDEVLQHISTARCLIVFDDLGTENPTDWAAEQLYRVFDRRSDGRLPTIITTNQLLARLDGRILSRFREGLVVCKGRDVRGRTE